MRTFRLLIGISVFWFSLSMLSDGINTLVLPNVLLGLVPDASKATVLGLLSFAGLMIGMLVQPYAGAWSDHMRSQWGRRRVIGIGVFLMIIALAVFGIVRGLLFVFIGFVLLQIAISISQAAEQGFIPDLIPASLRGRASGLKSFMDIGGAMIGFVLLGQLLATAKLTVTAGILAGVLLLGYLLTVLFVREPTLSHPASQSAGWIRSNPFRLNLQEHRSFFWLIVSRFLFLLGTYAVGRFLLYFVSDRLNLNAAQASEQSGILLGALALVTVLGAIPSGWAVDRFGRIPVMILGCLSSAAGIVLFIFASTMGLMILFGVLMSFGSAMFASANWAMSADLVPPDQAGRFFGLLNVGTAGASAVAGLFGPLIDYGNSLGQGLGYTFLFILAAAVSLGAAVVLRNVTQIAVVKAD